MSYQNVLQAVDTQKALQSLGMETTQSGSYIYFKCPKCQGRAVAKAWGEKKNLTYCTACKDAGNIIKLVETTKEVDYEKAKETLRNSMNTMKPLTEPPTRIYELEYHEFIEKLGITKEVAEFMGIGVPKGRTMLAGCVAFKISNEQGKHVAYYGLQMKDFKPKFDPGEAKRF